jgi:hypothetical protein
MAQLLSEKLNNIVTTLIVEVNDINKEYVTEKIDSKTKKEGIDSSLLSANIRMSNAVKNTMAEIVSSLKGKRVPEHILQQIKDQFNAYL